MKTIVFSNQKGGVGKTTCSFNIGIWLASEGYKTLLIDCDPQANLSKSLIDVPPHNLEEKDNREDQKVRGLYEALTGVEFEAEEVKPNLYLLAGDVKLSLLEKSLIGEIDAYTRLKDLLNFGNSRLPVVDYILIDSPPSLGVLTINALTASDCLIIPMNPSLYSMQGTNDLMNTVSKIKKGLNPGLNMLGVIINAFDSIPVITRQIKEEIISSFGGKVFQTSLSKSIRIEESIAEKTGVISTKSKAAEEVRAIGEELLRRLENVYAG